MLGFRVTYATELPTDSVREISSRENINTSYRFEPRQFIVPGVLLAAGIAGVYTARGWKESVQNAISYESFDQSRIRIDEVLTYIPAAGYLTLGFIPGMPHRTDFRGRLMAGVTSYIVTVATTELLKFGFHERRPNSGNRDSFPSGHTARAFTGAELMRIEYGNLAGLGGYAFAVTVGALRMYNNRHWINDVIGGAAIGILSARIGYWLLPLERKLFGLDKRAGIALENLCIVPFAGKSFGLGMTMTF